MARRRGDGLDRQLAGAARRTDEELVGAEQPGGRDNLYRVATAAALRGVVYVTRMVVTAENDRSASRERLRCQY